VLKISRHISSLPFVYSQKTQKNIFLLSFSNHLESILALEWRQKTDDAGCAKIIHPCGVGMYLARASFISSCSHRARHVIRSFFPSLSLDYFSLLCYANIVLRVCDCRRGALSDDLVCLFVCFACKYTRQLEKKRRGHNKNVTFLICALIEIDFVHRVKKQQNDDLIGSQGDEGKVLLGSPQKCIDL
jgi:hypothetical protein